MAEAEQKAQKPPSRVDFGKLWNYAATEGSTIAEALKMFPMFTRDQINTMFDVMRRTDVSERFRWKKILGRDYFDRKPVQEVKSKKHLIEEVSPWQENAIKELENNP